MSSRQLEERYEQEQSERLAAHLGLTVDELDQLSPDIDTNESNDGLVYNHVLNFHSESPKELLAKVVGLEPGSLTMWVELGVLDHDEGDDEPND